VLLTACSTGTPSDGPSGGSGLEAPEPDPEAGAAIQGVRLWDYEAPDHTTLDHEYEQQPPVHGPHWVPRDEQGRLGWLACGTYEEPVPEEFALHSMEHGAVWLTWRDEADAAALEELAERQPDYVLVSPYPAQAGPVTATTWDVQLVVDSADDPRLAAFVDAWAGGAQGREPGADCANGTSLEDARQAVADADQAPAVVRERPSR
jgi:hypothetical protein